jgi:cadmium resistance protein CadD (predicted permease)
MCLDTGVFIPHFQVTNSVTVIILCMSFVVFLWCCLTQNLPFVVYSKRNVHIVKF